MNWSQRLGEAVQEMQRQHRLRHVSRNTLRESIIAERRTLGRPPYEPHVLEAVVNERRGKEWVTSGPTKDYQWAREEVQTYAALEQVELLHRIAEQNERIITLLTRRSSRRVW